jgi:CheY-like chemotaxis protein
MSVCCKAFERLLRSAGISVKTFASGSKFLQAVRDYLPDCVVVDLHMPGIDGFEVLGRLANDHAALPVIVMTGYDTPESRARALAGGARSYLCKPVDDGVLLAAISAVTGP